jgi:rod shape-determining protein MreC
MHVPWSSETVRRAGALERARRRRKGVFLAEAALALIFLGLWGNSPTGGPLSRAIAGSFTPIVEAEQAVMDSLTGGTGRVQDLWRASSELARVRERNRELEARLAELEEIRRENEFLRSSVGAGVPLDLAVLPARVIGRAGMGTQSVVVERGERHGVAPYDAVLSPRGAVGYVSRVLEHTSSVLLLTDRSASVGVAILPDGTGPAVEGRIRGLPDGIHLLLQTKTARPLPTGSRVVTSRLSTIFPAGLVVGEIREMTSRRGSLQDEYVVEPVVDGRDLDSVLILTGRARDEAMELEKTQSLPGGGIGRNASGAG